MQAFVTTFSATSGLFGAAPCASVLRSSHVRALSMRPAQTRRTGCRISMHGPPTGHDHGAGAATEERRPGSHKGFIEEMRFVAMRLHTKDQAPREGAMEESALPIDQWLPSHAEFMQFLADSLCVYEYFENHLTAGSQPMFTRFANTGLERCEALQKDIKYLNGLGAATPEPTESATRYVEYMRNLENDHPEKVLCHWYNYYFAHSAGGRMIGRMMQDKLFEGHKFEFWEWESDVKKLLIPVRETIDSVAKDWSRDLKDECLKETGLAFGYSGTILQNLAKSPTA